MTTGLDALDALLGGLIPGDNVVWVADSAEVVAVIEDAFLRSALAEGRTCSYVTATTSPEQLARRLGGRVDVIDARSGTRLSDPVSLEREMIGRATAVPLHCTVVDNLSTLAERWGPEKTLAFFSRTCPQLFNLRALAYWRSRRDPSKGPLLDGFRRITQCVIEIVDDHLRIIKAEGHPEDIQGERVRFHLTDGTLTLTPELALGRLSQGLIRLRKSHNLTQAALAQIARVTPSAISQAETGHRGLSLDTLLVISDRLDVSLDDLLVTASSFGYTIVRHDQMNRTAAGETLLFNSSSMGLRVTLVQLGPGQAGVSPGRHDGPELVLVAGGLIQLEVGEDRPVVRSGDVVLASSVPIDGWRNLLPRPASIFWIIRDP